MATMDSVAVVEQEAKATIAQTNVITKETKVSGAPVNVVNKDTLEQDTQEESVLVPFAADGAAYIYSQTPDALTVMLQVVPGIQTTEVDLEVTESGVSLMIRGTTVLRVCIQCLNHYSLLTSRQL